MTLRIESASDHPPEGRDVVYDDPPSSGPGDSQARGLTQRLRELVSPQEDEASDELADGPSRGHAEEGVQKTGLASMAVSAAAEIISAVRG